VTENNCDQLVQHGVEDLPRGSGERIVRANGVELCVETFGDPADPAILLIHGAGASMHGWEEAFCVRLASGPRFVIRYDHRDTGRSVSYQPGAPPYTLRDLTADAIGVLDALGLDRAHLVGRSMGGGIAMLAAREYPDRVASLALVGTSPGGPDLPPPSEEFLAYIGGSHPDWSDRQAVIDHVIALPGRVPRRLRRPRRLGRGHPEHAGHARDEVLTRGFLRPGG
jgi:pimeloyl-ACP methyl ester carboxylesterase